MSYTQAQLDALKSAYVSGVKTVKHGENSVTYATMAEMAAAIAKIERSLSGASRITYPEVSRGT